MNHVLSIHTACRTESLPSVPLTSRLEVAVLFFATRRCQQQYVASTRKLSITETEHRHQRKTGQYAQACLTVSLPETTSHSSACHLYSGCALAMPYRPYLTGLVRVRAGVFPVLGTLRVMFWVPEVYLNFTICPMCCRPYSATEPTCSPYICRVQCRRCYPTVSILVYAATSPVSFVPLAYVHMISLDGYVPLGLYQRRVGAAAFLPTFDSALLIVSRNTANRAQKNIRETPPLTLPRSPHPK